MDFKRVLIVLLLSCSCLICHAQERVILDHEYGKNEYIDDRTASNKEYFGWAYTGASYSDAVWRIARITYTGTTFVLEWADSDQLFNNKMSEYELYTYG